MMGGLAYMTGRPGDPLRAGTSVNDIMGGMFGAIGALGALVQRGITGKGMEVQSALFENNVFLVGQHMLQYAVTGRVPAPMPARDNPWAVYDVFTVKDGEQIFLAAVSDAQFATFCDALGFADLKADPLMVRRLFEQCATVAGERLACGHFHDTRGLGLANVYAAWDARIRRFDACLGGIGGCPHAPGASGNVATEDVAYLFASMGVATGLDFDALIALRADVATWLEGETLHGTLWRAGLPKTLRPDARATPPTGSAPDA